MRAVVITKYGDPEGLQLQQVETPTPKANEVRIKICATTVTAGDVILRRLSLPLRLVFRLVTDIGRNKILGHELAGNIDTVGANVTQFQIGDSVFASTGTSGGAS